MLAEFGVPASVSNLGPGFDALAVAVQLYLRVKVIEVLPGARGQLVTEFLDAPPIGDDRISTAFARASGTFGADVPGLRVQVRSDIPQRAGLGSSAAAAVAGLKLYDVAAGAAGRDWLPLATSLEGHPDNAVAALRGGIGCGCQCDDGTVLGSTWRWPEDIRIVAATPEMQVETRYARSVLPQTLSLRDAVFNLQRAVLFVRALADGRHDILREAMRDRWHQPVRAALVPALDEALALDVPGLLGVCLAGSGPTVVALVSAHDEDVVAALTALYDRVGLPVTIRVLEAHQPDLS